MAKIEKTMITLQMPDELLARVDGAAEEAMMTRSAWLRNLIVLHFQRERDRANGGGDEAKV